VTRALFVVALAAGCGAPLAERPAAPLTPLEKKFAAEPNDAATNIKLGLESEATGDHLRAEQYYLRAEALGTPQDKIVPLVVRVLIAAKRYDEALARTRRRLAAAPDDRATRYVQAALLQGLDKPREAERDLLLLQRSKPDDPEAWLALGRLYREARDHARAAAHLKRFLELSPEAEEAPGARFELAEEESKLEALKAELEAAPP
jgi:predicted Zn-dependent protease